MLPVDDALAISQIRALDDEYAAVFDSAEKASKWKRCRLISSGDPNVAEIVASEPSSISSDAATAFLQSLASVIGAPNAAMKPSPRNLLMMP